jgi:GT2 family glycosyltransferase
MVRFLGRRTVERYLERLSRVVREVDPEGLVTYVNYPTTEYLDLPFLDLLAFNVYLESQDRFEAYLARLQNLAGDKPLLMSELGLDSLRNGQDRQAESLDWQIRSAFRAGCAGTFVFAWTDEWQRDSPVADWAFGLTDEERRPKPALAAARHAYSEAPLPHDPHLPRISVIVCSFNGARTIRECCKALTRLDYLDYEVIVVDDGSTDGTAEIAREYGFRVISTENRGLSSARNTGLAVASGEIVAYVDDDAYPDPHWLRFLAEGFKRADLAALGGPNIPPPQDGLVAQCVANAPGGPIHVLLSDTEAEHIPGCNMAFRVAALRELGGFDTQFRVAGDDVDVCWRVLERGWRIGFHPGAMVWHHRRGTIGSFWKQQRGYGRAEALLERKWPSRYNNLGHPTWSGRLYGRELFGSPGWSGGRIYQGTWGTAPFQPLYAPAPGTLRSLPLMPEWYLVLGCLAGFTSLGVLWRPMLAFAPLLLVALAAAVALAGIGAARATFDSGSESLSARWTKRCLTALLHLLQPLARLHGRVSSGLTPWRRGARSGVPCPWPRRLRLLEHCSYSREQRIAAIEAAATASGTVVRRGGDFDDWDLETRGGLLGCARLVLATEEYPGGSQLVRVRAWPHCGWILPALGAALLLCGGLAAADGAWLVAAILAASAGFIALRIGHDCSEALAALLGALAPDNSTAKRPEPST